MNEPAALRSGSLTFLEVLATSVALIGPSMTPILIAPYIFANAGNGTWLAYAFGGTMLVFVALNINQFTRRSSAAGSMYGYVADNLGPMLGAIAGWSLLWAYGFVAAAVLGAMALFTEIFLDSIGLHAPAIAIVCTIAIVAWQAAYRGVQVSAILMLVLEAISVVVICVLVGIVLLKHGPSIDSAQITLRGGFPNIGLAIMFAVFSFVGFESATAFGAEAKNPLVTIPRAVLGSVVFVSIFFIVATYAEILGLAHAAKPLDQETFPLGTLADIFKVGYLRIPITIGALCSAFSVCLACITTAGRVAYAMAAAKLLPSAFARIEPKHDTPNVAVTVVTGLTLLVAVVSLAARVAPIDIFNNCGTLSSFGFIVIYALISIAAGVYVKRQREMRSIDFAISVAAVLLLLVPAVMLFYSVPAPPQRWFVYYFLIFLAAGWAWFAATRRNGRTPRTDSTP
ncbi:MAG: APC family permease [Candidatus Tumulicola sp.]